MAYFFYLYLLAVSFAPATGAAEFSDLSGVVIDGSSGAVIEGASVYVSELNTGTLTAKDGKFAFKVIPNGVYSVRVSLVGYALHPGTSPYRSKIP